MPPRVNGLADLVEVGRGGFGTVYRASDDRFGRTVAVKVIRDAGLGSDVVARFKRECLALGSLSGHPNIVTLHDSGATDDGDLYLVMEFLGGGSMTQRLATRGIPDPLEVATWGAALAGALETAHRAGIVHRDVKPENVLFSDYGAPKLVDFGIARMRSAYETRTGSVSATLSHAAPEIVAGSSVTPAADVYSLASVLFTMLAGRAPFDLGPEESIAPLIARIASAPPPDLRQRGVPDAIVQVVERGLSKVPGDRFGSAAALGQALADAAQQVDGRDVVVPLGDERQIASAAGTIAAGPPTPRAADATVDVFRHRISQPEPAVEAPAARHGRRTALLAVAAVVAVAGIGAGAWAVTSRGGSDDAADLAASTASTPSTSSSPAVGATPAVYTAEKVKDAGLSIERTFAVADGNRVKSTILLTNTTAKPVVRYWAEVIPKELALDVSAVGFKRDPTAVIDPDPIVYWRLKIPAGASTDLAWSTKIPNAAPTGDALIPQVVEWHDAALASKQPLVDQAIAQLQAAEATQAPDPDPGTDPGTDDVNDVLPPIIPVYPTSAPVDNTGSNTNNNNTKPTKPTKTKSTAPVKVANRAPSVSVGGATVAEGDAVSIAVSTSDPDGDTVTVTSVSGLPGGLGLSGGRITGTLGPSASSVTSNWQNIRTETRTVTVTVRDAKGSSASTSFALTIRDTQVPMPNFVGTEGQAGGYDVADMNGPGRFAGCVDDNRPKGTIARQSVPGGSPFTWGGSAVFTYIHHTDEGTGDPPC